MALQLEEVQRIVFPKFPTKLVTGKTRKRTYNFSDNAWLGYNKYAKAKMVKYIKKYYHDQLEIAIDKKLFRSFRYGEYPLYIMMDIHRVAKGKHFDVSNSNFYMKYFLDTLQDLKLIPEDDFRFIIGDGKVLTPVEEERHRKLQFIFFKSNSPIYQKNSIWYRTNQR